MGTGNALNLLLTQPLVQQSTSTAVAVGDEDRMITAARSLNEGANGGGNLLRPVMQLGRKTADVDLVPAIGPAQGGDLVCQRSTGDDQQPQARRRAALC